MKIQELIKNFNEDFKTKLPEKETPFLNEFFDGYINVYSKEKQNRENLDKFVELEEKISKSCNEEQMNLFDKWNAIQDDYLHNAVRQSFVYGYCTCKQLDKETKM